VVSAKKRAKEGHSPKDVVLPLLARLACKRLQIRIDILHMITNTSDSFFSRMNIIDLERF